MPDIPYDVDKRSALLQRLHNRDRLVPKADLISESLSSVIIFKCQFGHYLKPLGLQKELQKLFQLLRLPLGDAFLQDTRTIIAHPVSDNLFRRAHRYNFVLSHHDKRGSG